MLDSKEDEIFNRHKVGVLLSGNSFGVYTFSPVETSTILRKLRWICSCIILYIVTGVDMW